MGHDGSTGRWAGVELTEVTSGLQFPEGPIVLDDGSVLVVEIARGTLTRVRPDGSTEVVADCGGGPNGAAIGPDGAVYLCNNGGFFDYGDSGGIVVPTPNSAGWAGGSIQRVDLARGTVESLYTHCDGTALRAPNDIVFDDAGGFWFTDHGVHADDAPGGGASVLYARADGSGVEPRLVGLDATNGVGLSPEGDRLYVAETYRARLLSWALDGPGVLAARSGADDPDAGGDVLVDLGGTALFDSLAVDGSGSVCVATLLTGGITVVDAASADGAHNVEFLATGDPMTTNICFGGDGHRTAYLTLSGSGRLVRCTWPTDGLGLAYHR